MIAEIKGKINRNNTNLTELGEDELTGNLFGCLRYISFNKGMKKILKNGVRPIELQSLIEDIDVDYWKDNICLWDKVYENGKSTELDVRMDFETVVIGIEVKYRSGLSSEDSKNDENISAENSMNQLSREARVLRKIALGKTKILLLLANDSVCAETIKKAKDKIAEEIEIGYISWQEVLIQLQKLTDLDMFEQLIVDDLIELLEKKGFLRFENFNVSTADINRDEYWKFELLEKKETFTFKFDQIVEDEYYEFE